MRPASVRHSLNVFVAFAAIGFAILLLFELGQRQGMPGAAFFRLFDTLVLGVLAFELLVRAVVDRSPLVFLRWNWPSLLVLAAYWALSRWTPHEAVALAGGTFAAEEFFQLLVLARMVLLALKFLMRAMAFRDFLANASADPAKTFTFGFAVVIVVGAILLTLPVSLKAGKAIAFIDALFMSTSAVCVTGLAVVDPGSTFSGFGQTVLLLLVQAGGLGIMTLAVFVGVFLRDRLSLRERSAGLSVLDQSSATTLYALIRQIVKITLLFELAGALVIFAISQSTPPPGPPMNVGQLAFYSVFHSVCAFCNAGFSLNGDSLVYLAGSFWGNFVFIFLIVFGGLGFQVLVNLRDNFRDRLRAAWRRLRGRHPGAEAPARLTIHSRMAVAMTLILVTAGALLFWLCERDATLRDKPAHEQVMASVFQSVTPRTAGFNTVDYSQIRPATLLVTILLMFIGASPGSTGGGIKTTTFYALLLTIRSLIRGRDEVEYRKRVIPKDVINKALAITVLFAALVCLGTGLILFFEPQFKFVQVFFEVVSAAATAGLSTGITPALAPLSKAVLILVMFLGRIGPLTLVLAMGGGASAKRLVRYPEEKVMVG